MSSKLLACGAAVFGLVFATSVANAQARLNRGVRPSEQGPSAQVGNVGGVYTRTRSNTAVGASTLGGGVGAGVVQTPATAARGSFGYARNRFSNQVSWQFGVIPEYHLPRADRTYALANFREYDPGRLLITSGLQAAQQMNVPLGYTPSPVRETKIPIVTPSYGDSDFHQFFHLSEAPPLAEDVPVAEAPTSWASALQVVNDANRERVLARAISLFKDATNGQPDENYDRLAQAMRAIRTAERSAPRSATVALLVAHAALEQGNQRQAVAGIFAAVEHDPAVFASHPPVAEWFGNAGVMAKQLRAYTLYRSTETDLAQPMVIQAYCAWLLGDKVLARQSADRAMAVADDDALLAQVKQFRYALLAALNNPKPS